MRIILVTLISLSLSLVTVANNGRQQRPAKSSAEQEIRAALCEIDQHAYRSAEQRMERLLQSDATNLDARKVLLSARAAQIKLGDTSPENIALIRKAIDGYQEVARNPRLTADEKRQIDDFVVLLYGKISLDEKRKELERRATDPARTAKDRSSAYVALAEQAAECSYQITERPEVKQVVVKDNQPIITYNKPPQKDFELAQACVKRGLDEAETAIKLDPANENAWLYKTDLLLEAAKLAEMAGDSTQKAAYRKQSDEANEITNNLATKHRAEEDQELARQQQERKDADSSQPEDDAGLSAELVELKRENSPAEAIKTIFIPDIDPIMVIAPASTDEEKPSSETASSNATGATPKGCFREVDGPQQVQEKRNWKTFAPQGEDFIVDLPDNVCQGNGGGYFAASEGVMYSILPTPRPAIALTPAVVDGVLNTLARTFANMRSRNWLDAAAANSFELKLLRKETVSGHPRKLFTYSEASCQVRKESVLLIHAAKTHYYTIDINGANEHDPRVQRFLSSLRVK